MSQEVSEFTSETVAEPEREITAKFSRDELVRGWREREPRTPHCVPVVKFAAKTDLGRIRENNEDKFDFYETEDPTVLAHRGCLYAVADGMGGHAAGQIASEMALKNLIQHYYDSPNDDVPTSILEALSTANEAIYNLSQMIKERSGMGTTLTAAVVLEDRVYVGQVGDSRAYLLRNGEIRQVTFDHSWVAEQVRAGALTEEEAESSPYRNVITRSIGTQPTVEPDVFIESATPGDTWVLCSDGLTGHVSAEEIRLIASSQAPAEAARQLIELANSRGGRDNITVFVFTIRDLLGWEGAMNTAPIEAWEQSAESSVAQTANERPSEETGTEKRGLRKLFGK
jgi:PPM family protein phosphatase